MVLFGRQMTIFFLYIYSSLVGSFVSFGSVRSLAEIEKKNCSATFILLIVFVGGLVSS